MWHRNPRRTCVVRVGNVVLEYHKFCGGIRRSIRHQKLLCGIFYIYWLFTEHVNDREAVVPGVYKHLAGRDRM